MRISLIIIFSLIIQVTLGQPYKAAYKPIPKYDLPKSPNADAFEQYTNVPANYETGQIAPTVPLISFTVDGLTVPVALNYSNTGLKILDTAPWVGLGWNLNIGGMITREVKGIADDGLGGLLDPNRANDLDRLVRDQMTGLERWDYFKRIAQQLVDTQHDIFHYQILGISGSFYINKSGKCVQLPGTNNLIEYTKDSYGQLSTFSIIDERDNHFLFQLKEESTVTSMGNSVNGNDSNYYPSLKGSTWYLTSIQTVNNQEVNFTYNHYQYSKKEKTQSRGYASSVPGLPNCGGGTSMLETHITTLVDVYQLSQIQWKNGYIKFEEGPSRSDLKQIDQNSSVPCLGSVSLYQTQTPFSTTGSKLLKSMSFSYDQTPRLFLRSISFNESYSYQFSYINENFPTWPSYTYSDQSYNAQDYWGYYNGQLNNYELLPYNAISDYPTINGTTSNTAYGIIKDNDNSRSNRVPDPNYASYGLLQQINYPTGGKTIFSYEGNVVQKNSVVTATAESQTLLNTLSQSTDAQNNTLVTLGGIRVKKIEFYSDASSLIPSLLTNVVYDQANFSNKFLPSFITTFERNLFQSNPQYGSAGCTTCGNKYIFTLYSSSIVTSPAPIVEYSTVTEYNGSSIASGQTVHYFRYSDLGGPQYYLPPYPIPFVYSWHSGEAGLSYQLPDDNATLIRTNNNGSNNHFYTDPDAQSANYDADFTITALRSEMCPDAVGAQYSLDIQPNNNSDADSQIQIVYKWAKNFLIQENYVPTQLHETTYGTDRSQVQKVQNYNYDLNQSNLLLPNSISTTNSKGQNIQTLITYPQDYGINATNSTSDPIALGIANLISRNFITVPIEQLTTLVQNNNTYVTGGKLSFFYPHRISDSVSYTLDVSSPVLLTNFTKSYFDVTSNSLKYDSRYFLDKRFTRYDSANQLLEFCHRNTNWEAFVWDKTSSYIVAHIINAKYSNIFYDGFEEGDGNSSNGDAKTGHYSYNGNFYKVLSGLDNGSYILSYWSNANSSWSMVNTTVTVSGGTYTISLPGQIDDIRFYPSNAQVTSYTYDPLVGMTSSTDAKGMTTTYEYDAFQRLLNVKDKDGNIIKHNDYHYQGQ